MQAILADVVDGQRTEEIDERRAFIGSHLSNLLVEVADEAGRRALATYTLRRKRADEHADAARHALANQNLEGTDRGGDGVAISDHVQIVRAFEQQKRLRVRRPDRVNQPSLILSRTISGPALVEHQDGLRRIALREQRLELEHVGLRQPCVQPVHAR